MPICSICLASLRHSFLASGSSHFGQLGAFFTGLGSFVFNGRLPGFPSSSLMAVGVGFLPLVAMRHPSLLKNPHQKRASEEAPKLLCILPIYASGRIPVLPDVPLSRCTPGSP